MKPCRLIDPPAGRLFAVGDIHGCSRELNAMLDFLDSELRLSTEDLVVFMGDYVDRGPDSRGVLARLIDFKENFSAVFLRGNHEDMFLDFLGFEGSQGGVYLLNGGGSTLRSYGMPLSYAPEMVVNDLPNGHLAFLLGLESCVRSGDFFFAHAGVHPLKPLDRQVGEDLFWIRDEFIQNVHPFGVNVIFGHTPYRDIYYNPPYKTGIDTGLVYNNMLSCVDLTSQEVFQVMYGTSRVVRSSLPGRSSRVLRQEEKEEDGS